MTLAGAEMKTTMPKISWRDWRFSLITWILIVNLAFTAYRSTTRWLHADALTRDNYDIVSALLSLSVMGLLIAHEWKHRIPAKFRLNRELREAILQNDHSEEKS